MSRQTFLRKFLLATQRRSRKKKLLYRKNGASCTHFFNFDWLLYFHCILLLAYASLLRQTKIYLLPLFIILVTFMFVSSHHFVLFWHVQRHRASKRKSICCWLTLYTISSYLPANRIYQEVVVMESDGRRSTHRTTSSRRRRRRTKIQQQKNYKTDEEEMKYVVALWEK